MNLMVAMNGSEHKDGPLFMLWKGIECIKTLLFGMCVCMWL